MTSPLAPADLTWLKDAAGAFLPETAYVLRYPTTDDDQGGRTVGTPTTTGPYPCRVEPWVGRRAGTELIQAGQFDQAAMWRVFLPPATDVTAKDQITVGSRVFDVEMVAGPETWEVQRMTICVERLT